MEEKKSSVYGAVALIFLLILALGGMSNYAGMCDAIVFGESHRWNFAIHFFSLACGLTVGVLFMIFANAAAKRWAEKRRNKQFYCLKEQDGRKRRVYV